MPKKTTLPATARKVITLVDKKLADLQARLQDLLGRIGTAVDGKFNEVAHEFAAVRGGLQKHDQGILVLQRVINDAVSGSKVRTVKSTHAGAEIDLVNWGWYLRQLEAALVIGVMIYQGAEYVEEVKEDPGEESSGDGVEEFGGDYPVVVAGKK